MPKPTISGTASVPERMPRSWPPPSMIGSMRTRGLRRTHSAPTPFGPYILCAVTDARSTFAVSTSNGILPTPCTASVWNSVFGFLALIAAPIASIGWTTPISLFASMIADDDRLVGHRGGDLLGRDEAVLRRREVRDLEALALQALAGVEHALVLGLDGDDVVALLLAGTTPRP